MFLQWSLLAIQAATTLAGVGKPVAMFSPASRQRRPTAVMRAAKLTPCQKLAVLTITFVHSWAERSSRDETRRAGRPCRARCWLIRQTTAARMAEVEADMALALALAHARTALTV